jgi:hypothetical protein
VQYHGCGLEKYNSAVPAFSSSFEQSENERNKLNLFTDPFSISDSKIINLHSKIKFEITGIVEFIPVY